MNGPDAAAAAEHLHAHAEPVQCLAELEADDAGAEHRDAVRQVVPVEDVVVDDAADRPAPRHAAGYAGDEPVAMTIDAATRW